MHAFVTDYLNLNKRKDPHDLIKTSAKHKDARDLGLNTATEHMELKFVQSGSRSPNHFLKLWVEGFRCLLIFSFTQLKWTPETKFNNSIHCDNMRCQQIKPVNCKKHGWTLHNLLCEGRVRVWNNPATPTRQWLRRQSGNRV